MAPRYQVRIKDQTGSQIALLTDWRRLEYTKRVNAPDTHVLALNGNLTLAATLAEEEAADYQFEVWRRDLEAGIASYLDYEGFHETIVDETTERALPIFTSYGRGYVDLIGRREILYPAGSSGAEKSGAGETVMKAYVNENAGPGATVPPRLYDGVTPGLAVEADGGAGDTWTGARSYQPLLDVLQEIADASHVDFGVVGTGPATFQFQAKAYPWGADRSVVGLDPVTGLNAAGNTPVVFSLGFGNMGSASYSRSRVNEVNAVIVLGQGLESLREVLQVYDPTAIALSPWNRREATRNANQESTSDGLQSVGAAVLHEKRAQQTFAFTVMQTPACQYGRDYFVGDIVTARYKAIERNYQITGVTVVVEGGRQTISLEVTIRE